MWTLIVDLILPPKIVILVYRTMAECSYIYIYMYCFILYVSTSICLQGHSFVPSVSTEIWFIIHSRNYCRFTRGSFSRTDQLSFSSTASTYSSSDSLLSENTKTSDDIIFHSIFVTVKVWYGFGKLCLYITFLFSFRKPAKINNNI